MRNGNLSASDIIVLAERLGARLVKRGPGDESVWTCPFGACDADSRPNEGHFYVNLRTGACFCHKCGEGGDILTLYAKAKGTTRREASRELNGNGAAAPRAASDGVVSGAAPVEHRDRVYRGLLGVLSLAPEHKADLLRRGLDESAVHRNGYKSVPQDAKLRWKVARYLQQKGLALEGVPGFFRRNGRYGPYWDFLHPRGYFIPVRNERGLIQALKIRLDSGSPKYVWFSSEGLPAGVTSGAPPHYTGGSGVVCVTEGPLKADVAHHLSGGLPFVGTAGVHVRAGVPELLAAVGAKEALVAFDADSSSNPNVARALGEFLEELRKAGFRPRSLSWPASLGKGIDDVLLRLQRREVASVSFLVDGVPVTVTREVTFTVTVGGKA